MRVLNLPQVAITFRECWHSAKGAKDGFLGYGQQTTWQPEATGQPCLCIAVINLSEMAYRNYRPKSVNYIT